MAPRGGNGRHVLLQTPLVATYIYGIHGVPKASAQYSTVHVPELDEDASYEHVQRPV